MLYYTRTSELTIISESASKIVMFRHLHDDLANI